MSGVILTQLEKVLLGITAFVLSVSIVLALCISLVLPIHWTTDDYVAKDVYTPEELHEICKCGQQRFVTNYTQCIPGIFTEHLILEESERKTPVCEIIHNYPYVVSLNAPAYDDDRNERRYVCAGIILSTNWILTGEDCVHHHDEWEELKVRAGSSYWSKGGTEYHVQAIATFSKKGPVALKVEVPFVFNQFISAVRIPDQTNYATWGSAFSVSWAKGNYKKYDKFIVRKWTTAPCINGTCSAGEVREGPASVCEKQKFGNALVTDTRVLVGVESEICNDHYNMTKYIFTNVQTEKYRHWLKFLITGLDETTEKEDEDDFSKPLQIYEVKECFVMDHNYTGNNDVSETTVQTETTNSNYESTISELKTQTKLSGVVTTKPDIVSSDHNITFVELLIKTELYTETMEQTKPSTNKISHDKLTSTVPITLPTTKSNEIISTTTTERSTTKTVSLISSQSTFTIKSVKEIPILSVPVVSTETTLVETVDQQSKIPTKSTMKWTTKSKKYVG